MSRRQGGGTGGNLGGGPEAPFTVKSRPLFGENLLVGIRPGWHGIENGPKPEMGRNGKPNGKQPPHLDF